MTNAKETPELSVPTPGSELEAKDTTSAAFKDELRAKFADYKRQLRAELATPPEVPHASPPWKKHHHHKEWTMAEKMEWWGRQPQPTPHRSSVAPELQAWLKDVYRKYIPESEDHDVFFDEREQEALAEAGF
ncbi:hypothetical protein H0H92_016053 [Tricholoma furcatifolium]|nr:hypothetical protein H0H92_016053 [Tricholoma furcatifolium]